MKTTDIQWESEALEKFSVPHILFESLLGIKWKRRQNPWEWI